MIPVLPVSMVPIVARAASSPAGFVLAVLIGLSLFAAAQSKQPATTAQPQL